MNAPSQQFRVAYAHHRAEEGRGLGGEELRRLPYVARGPMARQWAVRAKSYDAFVRHVVVPRERGTALDVLDLGAGNGWLAHRMAGRGHRAVALDIRDDMVDGLGVARQWLGDGPQRFDCVTASFDDLPFPDHGFDITVFNAALHYARDLAGVLGEARRVTRPGGILVIMDSPFYGRDADGHAMVAQKHAEGVARFGDQADVLLSQGFIEYLTPQRLAAATPDLCWSRRRVRYPLWYEMRPLLAWLKGARRPSRFDLWTAPVPPAGLP